MDSNFMKLFEIVEKVRQRQTEREQIGQEITEIKEQAAAHCCNISHEYREKESRYNERLKRAEAENEDNKRRISELMRQQIQAEESGEAFEMQAELDRLKAEVATYPQKVEALQSLKSEILIPAADMEILEDYRREWQTHINSISLVEAAIQEELINIRETAIPYCMATFEIIPALRAFLTESINRELEAMRKEETEDE